MPGKHGPVHAIETDLVLEALARRHGYDFHGYARASLRRRLAGVAARLGAGSVAGLIPLILYDDSVLPDVLSGLSVPVTEMFRDPEVFKAIRESALPILAGLPSIAIWQAGCATGEEAFSLAILLAEEGLLDKSRIHATDINDDALSKARSGGFAVGLLDGYDASHRQAGGRRPLAAHVSVEGGAATLLPALKDSISCLHHNLVSDPPMAKMDMVVCRNVLIYFERPLQDRVLALFAQSLNPGGVLCLGAKENLAFTSAAAQFSPVDHSRRIYRKL